MHDIEPHYNWRDRYIASKDEQSPFYGRKYDEFSFSNKIYNYLIHPQWDEFGSPTLYTKILFVDYEVGFAIFEFIGEWNDCIQNDIMLLKRNLIEPLLASGISKFILITENVLNFHGEDDCYYEEWYEDVVENEGWISFINVLNHVHDEMNDTQLHHYVNYGGDFNNINWRPYKPSILFELVNSLVSSGVKQLI